MQDLRWHTYGVRELVLQAAHFEGRTERGALHVRDEAGKVYLDAINGIGCAPLGHAHPRWVAAVSEQLARLVSVSNAFWTEPQQQLARRLGDALPIPDARVFFCNTGTEATEAAIKVVLRATGRDMIVAFDGAFHGRTLGALSLTANPNYREPYLTCPGEDEAGDRFARANVVRAPFNDLEAVRRIFDTHGRRIAGVFVEPVQGEAGIYPADRAFLTGLHTLCREHGALLGVDEIQAGFGRTGRWSAWSTIVDDDASFAPDVLWLAKALGGGYPIGACLARREIADAMNIGSHGTTFGGNPAACVAALTSMELLTEENGLAAASAQITALRAIARRKPIAAVVEIRGLGAMIGIEIAGAGPQPATPLVQAMLDRGVLVTVCAGRTVRLLLPYHAGPDVLEHIWDVLAAALEATATSKVT